MTLSLHKLYCQRRDARKLREALERRQAIRERIAPLLASEAILERLRGQKEGVLDFPGSS